MEQQQEYHQLVRDRLQLNIRLSKHKTELSKLNEKMHRLYSEHVQMKEIVDKEEKELLRLDSTIDGMQALRTLESLQEEDIEDDLWSVHHELLLQYFNRMLFKEENALYNMHRLAYQELQDRKNKYEMIKRITKSSLHIKF